MFETEIVSTVPTEVELEVTVTSFVPSRDPVPNVVSPTLRVTSPAVQLKPPNFADIDEMVAGFGRVVVKVILCAGLLPDPT